MTDATLALEDGRVFRGKSFGSPGERCGEVVFNTSMTGYQEIATDPSYRGQIVVMTCPEIGNYGTNDEDGESNGPQIEGLAVRNVSARPSNWRSGASLPDYLAGHQVPGIAEIDTRALTRHIRTRGAMKGIVSTIDHDADSLARKAREAPGLDDQDLVSEVTCGEPYSWDTPRHARWASELGLAPNARRLSCVVIDFGIKRNILRLLSEIGFDLRVVPATTPAAEVLSLDPDSIFLSNGPGDPTVPTYAIDSVRTLIGKKPLFGICLGHQIAALALGGKTFKLKFGHRGANHPVKDLATGKVAITAQNHGFAVDPDSLPQSATVTHINLNDSTCEGFLDRDARLLAVQYHPESSPGPHDSHHLFRRFRSLVVGPEDSGAAGRGVES